MKDEPLSPACMKCEQVTGKATCFPKPCVFYHQQHQPGTKAHQIAVLDRIKRGARSHVHASEAHMTETPICDTNAIISLIDDAIADSLGPDWNSFQAAHHVMQWLADAGLEIVSKRPRGTLEIIGKKRRGTECPSSHDGFHHVDTSMESGPNNCFHCEGAM